MIETQKERGIKLEKRILVGQLETTSSHCQRLSGYINDEIGMTGKLIRKHLNILAEDLRTSYIYCEHIENLERS